VVCRVPPGTPRLSKIFSKNRAESLDTRGHVPILRSSFFAFGFKEEKEVIMTSIKRSRPADDVVVLDIPET